MKKYLLSVVAAASLLMVSCGDKDFEEVQNLSGVTGGDISFALPVGTGTLDGRGLLSKWQNTKSEVTFEDDVVTFMYNDEISLSYDIDWASSVSEYKPTKADKIDTVWRKPVSGEIDIDIFDNFPNIDGMTIEGLKADLEMLLTIEVEGGDKSGLFDDAYKSFIGVPKIEKFAIIVEGEKGTKELPISENKKSFDVEELRGDGSKITISTDNDPDWLKQVLDLKPKKMSYSFQLVVPLHGTEDEVDAFIKTATVPSSVNDVIKIRKFNMDGSVKAKFPMRLSLNDVVYEVSIAFPLMEVQDAVATASKKMALDADFCFAFKFENSLPMSLTAHDMLLSRGNPAHFIKTYNPSTDPISLFGKEGFVIPAAPVEKNEKSGYFRSSGSDSIHARINMTKKDLDNIASCDSIRISFELNSTNHEVVEIMKQDKLITHMYILVNADDEYLDEKFGKKN